MIACYFDLPKKVYILRKMGGFSRCVKEPPDNFNFFDYVSFCNSNTRLSSKKKDGLQLQKNKYRQTLFFQSYCALMECTSRTWPWKTGSCPKIWAHAVSVEILHSKIQPRYSLFLSFKVSMFTLSFDLYLIYYFC